MKLFTLLYDKMMKWARHPHAVWYLAGVSFSESSFFLIPPDVMLAPMAMTQPQRAWWFWFVCTITSVVGGLFGYLIGHFCFYLIYPLFVHFGYVSYYQQVSAWFHHYGFWIIFFAGFGPIPYKIFTITAGVLNIALLPFIVASTIGRGGRFFLVTLLMKWGGVKMEAQIRRYVDYLGWLTIAAIIIFYLFYHFYK